MAMYKPSELLKFLTELGVSPKKALSQNFLIDGNIIRKIVKEAKAGPGDVVMEIGPGPGSLTEALLESGAAVIAVEKDNTLAAALDRFKKPGINLEVFCEDVMKFPIEESLSKVLSEGHKAKVIANLPYHLTSPIISHLVTLRKTFSKIVVMVQDEVARRFTALPGTSDYSSFTIYLNFFSTPRYAFTVSRQCFYPAPKVQSAVVVFDLKEPPTVSNMDEFFVMTRTAFQQRRKMLRGSLRTIYTPESIMEALKEIGKPPESRPEELSLDEFLSLFERLQQM